MLDAYLLDKTLNHNTEPYVKTTINLLSNDNIVFNENNNQLDETYNTPLLVEQVIQRQYFCELCNNKLLYCKHLDEIIQEPIDTFTIFNNNKTIVLFCGVKTFYFSDHIDGYYLSTDVCEYVCGICSDECDDQTLLLDHLYKTHGSVVSSLVETCKKYIITIKYKN